MAAHWLPAFGCCTSWPKGVLLIAWESDTIAPTTERRELLYKFYPYFQSKFKYTGKNNYSPLCVDYLHVYHRMNPKLRAVWDQMYTVSMRGHMDHNMALDQLIEKINKTCKCSDDLWRCYTCSDCQGGLVPQFHLAIGAPPRRSHGIGRAASAGRHGHQLFRRCEVAFCMV